MEKCVCVSIRNGGAADLFRSCADTQIWGVMTAAPTAASPPRNSRLSNGMLNSLSQATKMTRGSLPPNRPCDTPSCDTLTRQNTDYSVDPEGDNSYARSRTLR